MLCAQANGAAAATLRHAIIALMERVACEKHGPADVPRLERILVAEHRGAPMRALERVEAAVGQGLIGDRYAAGRGTFSSRAAVMAGAREVSLVSMAAVAACSRRLDMPIEAAALRRNLVVTGLDLMTMRGQLLCVGDVRLEIVSSCPPCGYLSRLLGQDMRAGLHRIGGMRAAVRTGGLLIAGQHIVTEQ